MDLLAGGAAGAAFLRPTPPSRPRSSPSPRSRPRRSSLPGGFERAAFLCAAVVFALLALRPGPRDRRAVSGSRPSTWGRGTPSSCAGAGTPILVDGGGPFDLDRRDFGRTRLLPKLLDRGVTSLDAVVLTHPHPDHALGLFVVLEDLPVGEFWRSSGEDESDFFAGLDAVAAAPRRARARARSRRDDRAGATRESPSFTRAARAAKWTRINNQSLVFLFERDGRSALSDGRRERGHGGGALLREHRVPPADILKVGHHGSRSSTTAAFLEAVCPRAALSSPAARENRFGHPARATLQTLAAARVPVFRTDLSSDLEIELLPYVTRLAWRGLE